MASINVTSSSGITRNRRSNRLLRNFTENRHFINQIQRFARRATFNDRRFSSSFSWSSAAAFRLLTISLLLAVLGPRQTNCVDPKFDPSTRMRLVLVPADAQVGSVIYRLRATDEEFDYPLAFEFVGDASASASTVKIESLPCTKYNSVCQANVVLQRRLEPGRYYDFQVSVKDTKGGLATQLCSITATNFTTPHDRIFPHKPGIIMIPEDAKRGTELDYVIARKNPLFQKPVYLELWGSPLFAIRQKIISPETTEGTVFLLGPLDFEKQAMYHLTILANDAYSEPGQDSRNIAGLEIVVIVQDVQDQPPVYTLAPPVTKLPSGLLPGDKILQVHAEDGDKGNPREVRYGLVSEGNPFTSFFDINDTSGEIFLMRPLEDIAAITHVGDPVLLTVIAEEVKVGRDQPPAMASTVQLAFFLPERTNSPPYFENDHYVSRVDENAPQGTALAFQDPYVPRVYDDDSGKNGVFSLTLLNNNGTFEISPNVAERSASFLIRVRDNGLLDYEKRQSVVFQILAQELGPATNLSAVVNVTVYINDVNDNPPNFQQAVYTVELPENMTVGTKIVQVQAIDGDSANLGGCVRYTAILGYLNTSLNLDAETGLITVSTNKHGFDREVMPEYHLYVEARDNDGTGNRAQVPLVIKISDVNDETPTFDKDLYEIILAPNMQNFTSTAVIHAVDKDATAPNNDVRYEIINGNYENKFTLNKITGELTISEAIPFGPRSPVHVNNVSRAADYAPAATDTFTLIARAYDLGVPIRFSTTTIRIYPPESRTRTISFVVPGLNPHKTKTEETLAAITGGKVVIHDIRPLQPDEPGAKSIGFTSDGKERSVVTATVLYDSLSVVDISQIQQRLSQQNSSYAIMMRGEVYETDTLTPLQTLYKAENKLLFWLLILLATLVALTILILALCCICSWCPLYGAASKRIVNISRTEDDVHLVHREMANGKQTKSVQVAEWMGRREAWSAEKPPDPRTKPTRWEFRDGREQPGEVVDGHHPHGEYGDINEGRRLRSSEEQKRRLRTNHSRIAKENTHLSFHNSRTNLINDRDVYIEDVIDERKIAKVHTEIADNFQSGHVNHLETEQQQHQQQQNNYVEEDRQIDDDSMRRHEIDRGSDIEYNTARSSLKNKREYFIKDGNVEILQLITRDKARADAAGEEDSIYVNVPQNATNLSHPQLLMVDNSGKEILMRRFIEEQPDGKQIIREHYQIIPGTTYLQSIPNDVLQKNLSTLKVDTFPMGKSGPNSIVYSQIEPEVRVIHTKPDDGEDTAQAKTFPDQVQPSTSNQSLAHEVETSLKQQNTLLRQILMEKQKLEVRFSTQDGALETQSLPGQSIATATQTDCDAGTQTDVYPHSGFTRQTSVGSKVRRKARSENDDSMSEPDYEYVRFNAENSPEGVYWIKRNRSKKRLKYRPTNLPGKRIVMVDEVKRKIRTPIREEGDEFFLHHNGSPPKKPIRFHGENKASKLRRLNNETKRSSGTLNRELLREITDSLDDKASPDKPRRRTIQIEQYYRNVDGEDFEQDANEYEVEHSTDIDSDTDEIVIKSHVCTPSHQEGAHRGDAKHRFEVHVKEGAVTKKSRSLLEREEHRPTANIRLSRTNSSKKIYPKNGQSNSDPSPSAAAMAKCHSNQSDLPDETIEPGTRSVPKYMEWYYSKKKPAASSRTSTDSSRGQSTSQQQADPVAAEKRISKTRINIGDNVQKHDEGKYKPEPAPRKSPQKGTHFLREDIAMNKQSKKSTDAEANHPLVQHSEHRFEREHFADVPTTTSKLSHYMYPEANNAVNASKEPANKTNKVRPKPSPIKENEIKVTKARINLYIEDPKAPPSLANSTQKLNVSTLEDDHDSGIAMNSLLNSIGKRNPIADKKSVFSIAYDDVSRVKKINSGGGSPQYS